MDNRTDEEIVKIVQNGDPESFGILIERYEEKFKRYARKFLSNPEDIKDVTQEIFIKIYSNIKSFDIDKRFSPWAYRIAHNELINVLRKKDRLPLPFFDPDTIFPHPVSNEKTDRGTKDDETKRILDKCLEKISPKYREVLMLYYLEEMDYKEISDIMHVPVSTVGVRLKRGKEMLKLNCNNVDIDYEQ
ncbi:MAG: RNA polymerase sigma factor [Patescibacteria group bacterium]